ncbi:response regulator [Dehalogenimonas sp. 4OHTPN]|uniref:Response regulator n=1 Tax=Dehalogenimonas sp. 4OHTPN TaxID=3166643 RepID=A0AAU8GDK0_9CHLR
MEVIAGEDIRASCLFRDIKPEVVVIDLDLPDAQGFRLAKDIRDLSDVPIITLSTHYVETEMARAVWAGVDAYLLKTVGMFGILAWVRSLLKGHSVEIDPKILGNISSRPKLQNSFPQRRSEQMTDLIVAS